MMTSMRQKMLLVMEEEKKPFEDKLKILKAEMNKLESDQKALTFSPFKMD